MGYANYSKAGDDGERSGWLAKDPSLFPLPEGCHWQSVHFDMGDVAIFGMDLLHTTIPNETTCFRLSCDTRWQPRDASLGDMNVGSWHRYCDSRSYEVAKTFETETAPV